MERRRRGRDRRRRPRGRAVDRAGSRSACCPATSASSARCASRGADRARRHRPRSSKPGSPAIHSPSAASSRRRCASRRQPCARHASSRSSSVARDRGADVDRHRLSDSGSDDVRLHRGRNAGLHGLGGDCNFGRTFMDQYCVNCHDSRLKTRPAQRRAAVPRLRLAVRRDRGPAITSTSRPAGARRRTTTSCRAPGPAASVRARSAARSTRIAREPTERGAHKLSEVDRVRAAATARLRSDAGVDAP